MVKTEPNVRDLAPTVENMVLTSAAVTAGRMHLDSPDTVWPLLMADDQFALQYFRYELARQIGILLVRSDRNVHSIYQEQERPESEEVAPHVVFSDPIRLVVSVEGQTAALNAMVSSLNSLLGEMIYMRTERVFGRTIDVHFIDHEHVSRYRPSWLGHRPPPMLLADRTVDGSINDQRF